MPLILSLDVGTTGLKTILVNETGNIIKSHSVEYGMIQEKTGMAEQRVSVWWEAVVASFQKILNGIESTQVMAVGVSGQFQSLIMLDAQYQPLQNAILWCDHRGEIMLPEITRQIGSDRLYEITANPALSGSTVSNLLWVRENRPEIYERCAHIMLPHEYIRFRLTGECVTDVTSASSMQLLNVPERQWSEELFDKLEVDRSLVGRLCECIEVVGETTKEIEELTGLPKGIPVIAGGGDSVVSSIGTGVIREGSCFTSVGTSGIICTNTKKIKSDPRGRVNTYCSAVPDMWSVITCSISAGLALKWMKENFCEKEMELSETLGADAYELMDRLAEQAEVGADGLIFLPYLMGDRTPHLNPEAKGMFFGITSRHKKKEFIRAVMEGVGYSLVEGICVLRELGAELDEFVLCGGGAKGNVWRKIIADIYGGNVATVQNDSGSAIGAAVLAACGGGIYSNLQDAVDGMIKRNKEEIYSEKNHMKYMEYLEVYRQLYERVQGLF